MASSPPSTDTLPLFRPSKKRKIYRQRADDDDDDKSPASQPIASTPIPAAQSIDELIASAAIPQSADAEADVEGAKKSIAELLRQRRKAKRVGGVEFKAAGPVVRNDEGEIGNVGEAEGAGELEGGINGVPRKFAPQTGTAGDVNKHMMAYIESEIAKRRFAEAKLQSPTFPQTSILSSANPNFTSGSPAPAHLLSNPNPKTITDIQRQPATIGKLHEIDLGDEARLKNAERTDIARRRLHGEEISDSESTSKDSKKPTKVRLGPDGKPWRSRKRRASEDIKRDKLVEEIMRENRLEIYEEPSTSTHTPHSPLNSDEDGLAADDRIAEAFRRDFMDAVSQRQRKKAALAQPPARTVGGKKEEEILKGPKLGGSRNARAAMRENMLKAAGVKK